MLTAAYGSNLRSVQALAVKARKPRAEGGAPEWPAPSFLYPPPCATGSPAWVGDKRTGLEEEEETKLGVGGSEFAIHRKEETPHPELALGKQNETGYISSPGKVGFCF